MQFSFIVTILAAAMPMATLAAPTQVLVVDDQPLEQSMFQHLSLAQENHPKVNNEACLMVCFPDTPNCGKPSVGPVVPTRSKIYDNLANKFLVSRKVRSESRGNSSEFNVMKKLT